MYSGKSRGNKLWLTEVREKKKKKVEWNFFFKSKLKYERKLLNIKSLNVRKDNLLVRVYTHTHTHTGISKES